MNDITVMPVAMSGVGSFMVVTIGEERYKSTAVQGEYTREAMDASMEEIYTQMPAEYRESVELRYADFLQAIQNTEEEVHTTNEPDLMSMLSQSDSDETDTDSWQWSVLQNNITE